MLYVRAVASLHCRRRSHRPTFVLGIGGEMAWRQACRSAQSPGSTLPSPGRHVCAQSAPIRCSVHHGSGLSMPNRACHGIRKSPNAHQQQPHSTQTAKSRIPQHAQHPEYHGTPPHHNTIPTITHDTTYARDRTIRASTSALTTGCRRTHI